jgi:hypothetical protein
MSGDGHGHRHWLHGKELENLQVRKRQIEGEKTREISWTA